MRLRTKKYELYSSKIVGDESISIAFLSDFHLVDYPDVDCVFHIIKSMNPDLVLVGGDMLTAREYGRFGKAAHMLQTLAAEYPVYYANGNHEMKLKENVVPSGRRAYEKYRKTLKDGGVHFLENSRLDLNIHSVPLSICGLELPLKFYRRFKNIDFGLMDMENRLGLVPKDRLSILLAHHPRFWNVYAAWGADITLSGHLHGGIARIGKLCAASPDGRILPKYGYGKFSKFNRNLIVSGGMGEHTIPFRIFNPREIIHIVIKKEAFHGDTC